MRKGVIYKEKKTMQVRDEQETINTNKTRSEETVVERYGNFLLSELLFHFLTVCTPAALNPSHPPTTL